MNFFSKRKKRRDAIAERDARIEAIVRQCSFYRLESAQRNTEIKALKRQINHLQTCLNEAVIRLQENHV